MSKGLAQWRRLLLISAAVSAILRNVHLPAALLLGPMAAGILLTLRGSSISIPVRFFLPSRR